MSWNRCPPGSFPTPTPAIWMLGNSDLLSSKKKKKNRYVHQSGVRQRDHGGCRMFRLNLGPPLGTLRKPSKCHMLGIWGGRRHRRWAIPWPKGRAASASFLPTLEKLRSGKTPGWWCCSHVLLRRMEIHQLSKLQGQKEKLVMETGFLVKSEANPLGKMLWMVLTEESQQVLHTLLWLNEQMGTTISLCVLALGVASQ